MGMSGSTPMRYAADKPHNPSSFQGHCRWPSKRTHSKPQSGGIASRRFHRGTAENGFFRRLYLLRCEYFFNVRMNGGGCDRCLAWTMQGARTPFQESNNPIVRAAATIDPSPRPFAQPMFPQRVLCVFRVVRALRVHFCFCLWRSCYAFCVCCAFCAFRPCCLCCCLWNCHWCVACSTESHFSTSLFCDATKISATVVRP